jgi:hypothetical protein
MNHSKLDPESAFPAEVHALSAQGVPLPTWFAGPIYTGNGPVEALKQLHDERQRATDAVEPRDEEPAEF